MCRLPDRLSLHTACSGLTAGQQAKAETACLQTRKNSVRQAKKSAHAPASASPYSQRPSRQRTLLRAAAAARRCKPAQAAAGAGDATGAGRSGKGCALPLTATPADGQPVARLRVPMLLLNRKVWAFPLMSLPLPDCVQARDPKK